MAFPCCPHGIQGSGDYSATVMIVGIAPGRQEVEQGAPFVGPTGKLLDQLLSTCGWDRAKTYCTNIVCWRTDDPTDEEIAVCYPRLLREIETIRPRLILALGARPTEVLTGYKVGRVSGQSIRRTFGTHTCWVMPTWHPAAVLNSAKLEPEAAQNYLSDLVRDFKKISRLDWTRQERAAPKYEFVDTPARGQEILNALPRDVPVAIDIETEQQAIEQTDAYIHQLVCLAIYDGRSCFVFDKDVVAAVQWPMDVKWTFHGGGSFDVIGIYRASGFRLPVVHDTLLLSYALDERKGYHGLKALSREYLGAPFWELQKDADLYQYNAWDVYNTWDLLHVLYKLAIEDNVVELYEFLIRSSNTLCDSQIAGVPINKEVIAELAVAWIPKLVEHMRALQQLAESYGYEGTINLNSPKQLSKLLFSILGLPILKRTPTGAPSTDKEVLSALDHPFVTELLEFRKLEHMINTYLIGVNNDIKFDGLLHPTPWLHGTVTGRLSYTAPPVQTIPQPYSVGDLAVLRKMFYAPPGYLIVEADYSQIEIWIGAYLSNDPQLLADLIEPYDDNGPNYHSRVTRDVLGVDERSVSKEVWEAARSRAKKITFGIMYLIGAAKLSNPNTGIGCTLSSARHYIDSWYRRYPVFQRWQQETLQLARKNGELVTPFGRKRRLYAAVSTKVDPQYANFKIQSIASDYTLRSANILAPQLREYDSRILFLVHDSTVSLVRECYLEDVVHLLYDIMASDGILGPVPIEIKTGPNWYETRKYVPSN